MITTLLICVLSTALYVIPIYEIMKAYSVALGYRTVFDFFRDKMEEEK